LTFFFNIDIIAIIIVAVKKYLKEKQKFYDKLRSYSIEALPLFKLGNRVVAGLLPKNTKIPQE